MELFSVLVSHKTCDAIFLIFVSHKKRILSSFVSQMRGKNSSIAKRRLSRLMLFLLRGQASHNWHSWMPEKQEECDKFFNLSRRDAV